MLILFLLAGCTATRAVDRQKDDSRKAAKPTADKKKADASKPPKTVYDYTLVDLDGKEISLSSFNGKLLLIVNLASQSVYRDQIDALNQLQKTFADQGLVVIGVPSADFGGEELKDSDALHKYYRDTAKVTFPVFALASLRGANEIPLYRFLTDPKAGVAGGGIHWNFTKILVDRKGVPLARFEVEQYPGDPDFQVTIESALAGKLKKKPEAKDDKGGSDRGDDDDE
jgi:glutathione peroxidase